MSRTGHLALAAARSGYFPDTATARLLPGFSVALGVTRLLRADEPERM